LNSFYNISILFIGKVAPIFINSWVIIKYQESHFNVVKPPHVAQLDFARNFIKIWLENSNHCVLRLNQKKIKKFSE
jgi:hypothetical protein